MEDLEETLNDSVRDSVLGRKKASAEATAAKKAAAERRRRQRDEDQDAGRLWSLFPCASLRFMQLLPSCMVFLTLLNTWIVEHSTLVSALLPVLCTGSPVTLAQGPEERLLQRQMRT
jgi:Flp pilus assembly protein TadB